MDAEGTSDLSDAAAGDEEVKQEAVADALLSEEVDGEGGVAEGATAEQTEVALGAGASERRIGTSADEPVGHRRFEMSVAARVGAERRSVHIWEYWPLRLAASISTVATSFKSFNTLNDPFTLC